MTAGTLYSVRMLARRFALLAAAAAALWGGAVAAQRSDAFSASRDHAAIAYSSAPPTNAVTALNDRLAAGETTLAFEPGTGYLRALLQALALPVESQVMVYSQTSFQARRINKQNPRAIYFSDAVSVGYVRGGDLLEIAVQDPRQGTIFYALSQTPGTPPLLRRDNGCLSCHLSWDTRAVPGPFVLTTFPRRSDADYANGFIVDHRAPIAERWGGWYVTGPQVPRSMGNLDLLLPDMPDSGPRPVPAPKSLDGVITLDGYLSPYSDVAALMVLDHQLHAVNLITRAAWEARVGSAQVDAAVGELVDYLLFVDEAPLPEPIVGSSGFTAAFSARGPRDQRGRSLRELDLSTRLMRYPLSYMIYSPGFGGLPSEVRGKVEARLCAVLTGSDTQKKYAHLTPERRTAIREILRDTLTPTMACAG